MSQPTPYVRQSDLAAYARNNSAAPYNATLVDNEFNAIAVTLDETLTNLALIQRDDGNLRMAIVTPDALDTATLNLIGDWSPRGPWITGQAYAVRDMVTVSTTSYVCATAHTASAFATDYALGYWQPVNGLGALPSPPATIQFTTNDVILGRVSSGGGDGEQIACTSAARSILDDATVAAIATTLGLGSASAAAFGSIAAASATLSGLTANAFLYSGAAGLLTSTAAPTNGQVLIGSTGFAPVLGSLTGTANQVVVTNGAGSITLSLPQSINVSATPTFATANLTNISAGQVLFAGASSALTGENNLIWDATNNRLGIGASSPLATLHINGGLDPTSFRFQDGSDNFIFGVVGSAMSIDHDDGATTFVASFEPTGSAFGAKLEMVGAGGSKASIRYATANVTAAVGATVTAVNLIPDGAFVLGVSTRITTTLGNGSGTTGYQVGDGSDADRWGAIAARVAGTTSNNTDATANFTGAFLAANSVVLTAVGGNFDGTGVFKVVVMYIDITAPSA